jgi:hypothetical protein
MELSRPQIELGRELINAQPEANGSELRSTQNSQHPEDAIEATPVVHTRQAARLVGEHRLDDVPFAFGKLVSHDPETRFGSWNHATW